MKKTALTFLLTAVATVMTQAQTGYDAWLFSENNYEGTARSVAMGNAFTALGGDLGAVTINPAGSAVAGYSQFTITPSLTISSNTTTGVPYQGSAPEPYFQKKMKSTQTRAGMPNIGLSFNFPTGRKSGLKSITAGFVVNRVNSWSEDTYARGTNSQSSFLAAAASDAQAEIEWMNSHKAAGEEDFTSADYLTDNAYDYMPWRDIVGYCSGMFSDIDGTDGKKFIGATQILSGNNDVAGELDQTYGRSVSGNKYEYTFNIGANISDFVYIGFNLGINSLTYDMSHYFREAAIDPDLFELEFTDGEGTKHYTNFTNALYKYSYSADGTGVFGKFGVIVAPGNGLRIGAAIQTPTSNKIREEWQEKGRTEFSDASFNGMEDSPVGENEYNFNSPWRANFGIAWTFGKTAVISADYEMADYRSMKYKINSNNPDIPQDIIEHFESVNRDIRNMYGTAHLLRLGAEVRPSAALALRAGYNLSSSAQKNTKIQINENVVEYEKMPTTCRHDVSLGAGYTSRNSFFADIACRYSLPVNEFIIPYSDYLEDRGILSPEILNRHSNWKVLLTLGWRF
jgi:hypothetical protein